MLDHPNIIKLYEVYEDETHVHLVMEYLSGGELFQQITKVGMFSEIDAIIVMKNLLSALSYFHKFGIIHRDLKPENLIMADKDIHSLNKIADFGLATVMEKGINETLKCGSPGYVAPEVLNGLGYDTKADIFSAGVILYTLLSGLSPFYGKTYMEVLTKNKEAKIEYPQKYWGSISDNAIDIVKKMVEVDPKKRYNAEQCLDHIWFSESSMNSSNVSLSFAIENFNKMLEEQNELKKDIKPSPSALLTCTPVMAGRGNIKDTSPIMIGRKIYKPDEDVKSLEENKLSKTPVAKSKRGGGYDMLVPLNKYVKKTTNVEKKKGEEDYQNDMDESVQVSLKDSTSVNDKNYQLLCHKDKDDQKKPMTLMMVKSKMNSKSFKQLPLKAMGLPEKPKGVHE